MNIFTRYVKDTLRLKRYLAEGLVLMIFVSSIQLVLPQFIRAMLDDFIPNKKFHEASTFFLLIVGAFFIRGLMIIRRNHQMLHFGYGFVQHMRIRVMRHLQLLSNRYYDRVPMGDIMTRMFDDINNLENMTTNSLLELVTASIIIVGAVIMLFSMNWVLTLLALCIMPLYLINFRFFRKRLHQQWRALQKHYSELSSEFSESIMGIKVIKSFSLEEYKGKKLEDRFTRDAGMRIEGFTMNAVFHVISEFLTIFGTVLVLLYGGYQAMNGKMTVGKIVAFYTYVGYLYNPMLQIIAVTQMIQRGMASAERIYELLDTAPWPQEKPDAVDPRPAKGVVEFCGVTFQFDNAKEPVLKDINFALTPGKTTALVGMSGAGKTTIVNLLLRFYDPADGRILLDGKDIRDLEIEGMRLCMSVVSQEGFLFTGTVMDNIRMGRLEASDSDVIESARQTGALNFIQNLPSGFQTIIGEQGIKLSGGQKQLIAITRAQLRGAPIVLLDEPTSAMDSETESLVQKSLEQVSRNRSMLIIAHRLSTILRADEILVLRKGVIVERGSHRELIEHGGFYKRVYHLQFEQFEEKKKPSAPVEPYRLV